MSSWDLWVEEALSRLHSLKLLRAIRPILPLNTTQPGVQASGRRHSFPGNDQLQVFNDLRLWDRASVEVFIAEATFQKWMQDAPSSGDDQLPGDENVWAGDDDGASGEKYRKLLLFSGSNYLGLSSHPSIVKAVTQV
ncbi:unnamed protein product, partial [Cuscuta europaea]